MSKDNGGPDSDKIQQARRPAFESAVVRDWDEHLAHFDRDGDGYVFGDIQAAWWAFNAALDCVEIMIMPKAVAEQFSGEFVAADCRLAINVQGLGLRVK